MLLRPAKGAKFASAYPHFPRSLKALQNAPLLAVLLQTDDARCLRLPLLLLDRGPKPYGRFRISVLGFKARTTEKGRTRSIGCRLHLKLSG